jgi:hypothetical protein
MLHGETTTRSDLSFETFRQSYPYSRADELTFEGGEDAGFERSEVEARRTRGGIFWSHHAWF